MSKKEEPKKAKMYNNRLDRSLAPAFRALTRMLGCPDAIEYDDHFSAEEPDRPGQFNSWEEFNKSVDKWYDATNTGTSVQVPNPRYCPDPEYFMGKKKEPAPEPKKTTLEVAELKNQLRGLQALIAGLCENDKADKKTLSGVACEGLEQILKAVDDLQVHRETTEEKNQREMDEFKNILDGIDSIDKKTEK
jgi:hypothetical protein